jgi:tRNA pseudouridine38-40 synthase
MHTFKLKICYDGSEFSGWQIQPGEATVQGTIADVAAKLTQEDVEIFGSGRTDAGVHALGQVAHFCAQSQLTGIEFKRAFNALLPPTIRVLQCEEVAADFHARFQAHAKTYQYRIYRGRVLSPFDRRYVLYEPFPLDVGAMAEAARFFEGVHDFSSFAASSGSEEGDRERAPTREIYSSRFYARTGSYFGGQGFLTGLGASGIAATGCSDEQAADGAKAETVELVYAVRGKSFLRYMVRKIVGTLLEVGRGKLRAKDMPGLFELRDRSQSGPTAPPQGLYLVSVEYPDTVKH